MKKILATVLLIACTPSKTEEPKVKAFCLPEVLQGTCAPTRMECEAYVTMAMCSPVKEVWLLTWKEHDGSMTSQLLISQSICELSREAMEKSGFPGSCKKL